MKEELKGLLLSLNLQYFAENEGEKQETPETPVVPEVKTFTQDDVNAFVAKEKRLAQERILKDLGIEDFANAKEGLAQLKEWKDAQKTEAQKQADDLEQAQKDLQKFQQEKQQLEYKLAALKVGVQNESLDDALLLASTKVSETVTIEAALKEVLTKYPQFGTQQVEEQPKPSFSGGNHTPPSDQKVDHFAAALAKLKL